MLYPNYRGYLFANKPQEVRTAVTLNRGPYRREDLVFRLEAVSTDSGTKTDHSYQSPADDFTATLDFGPLPVGVYQVRATLLGSDGKLIFEQPPYRVVKLDSKSGVGLKAWIDDRNLRHFGLFELRASIPTRARRDFPGADQHDGKLLHNQCAD